jgi:hypothetical protein
LLGDDRSPGASVTTRHDFDNSFDHGRLAENRIEQSTRAAFTRGSRFFKHPLRRNLRVYQKLLRRSTYSENFVGSRNAGRRFLD